MIIDIEVVVDVEVNGIDSDIEGNIEFISVVRLERVVTDIVAVERRFVVIVDWKCSVAIRM